MLKKITSGIACMALALLVGCGGGEGNTGSDSGNSFAGQNGGNSGSAKGSVYYLNFKPEVECVWQVRKGRVLSGGNEKEIF